MSVATKERLARAKAGQDKRKAQREEVRSILDGLTVLLVRANLADAGRPLLDRLRAILDAAKLSPKDTFWLRESAASWDDPESAECLFGVVFGEEDEDGEFDVRLRYGTLPQAEKDLTEKIAKASALLAAGRADAVRLLYTAITEGPWEKRWPSQADGEREIAHWLDPANYLPKATGEVPRGKFTKGSIKRLIVEAGEKRPRRASPKGSAKVKADERRKKKLRKQGSAA